MNDSVCRTLAILARGLPDVMIVKFPFIPPDHIMLDEAHLSKLMVSALIILGQNREVITIDQMLEFLLEVKEGMEEHPELREPVSLVA